MTFSVKQKLLAMSLIPLISSLFYVSIIINDLWIKNSAINDVNNLIELTKKSSDLVHEIQKERGITAGFLSSSENNITQKLKKQRQNVDVKKSELNNYIKIVKTDIKEKNILLLIHEIENKINLIKKIRNKVDDKSITTKQAIKEYTYINKIVLSIVMEVSKSSPLSKITERTVAYYNFLQGKERAGIERAVINSVLSNQKLSIDNLKDIVKLDSEQNIFFDSFSKFTHKESQNKYNKMLENKSIKTVDNIKNNVLNDKLTISANEWFRFATERIELLKEQEDYLSDELVLHSHNIKEKDFISLIIWIGTSSLITILTSIIVYTSLTNIRKQVDSLLSTMSEVSTQHNLKARSIVVSKDELGNIAEDLNSMLIKFSETMELITDSSIKLSTASEQTLSAVVSTSRDLIAQQDETHLVVSAIEEMTASIKEVAESTTRTADASNKATEIATESSTDVNNTVFSIQGVAEQIEVTGQSIQELHKNSNEINGIIDVIKGIADQTNLLALNAAIEAARAGDQGRGFAVVADEVRSLSKRTMKSTTEIEDLIKSFQVNSLKAYEQMNESKLKVSDSVVLANSIKVSLDNIMNNNTDISNMTIQIAAATEQQALVSQEIAEKMVTINSMSVQSATAGSQIEMATNEQTELAKDLKNIASEFIV